MKYNIFAIARNIRAQADALDSHRVENAWLHKEIKRMAGMVNYYQQVAAHVDARCDALDRDNRMLREELVRLCRKGSRGSR